VNRSSQLACAWAGVLTLVLFGIGLGVLAQFIPPPRADDSLQEVVDLYTEDPDRLRAGLVVIMVAGGLFAPFAAGISVQLKRIEGRYSPMTYTQLACGAVNVLLIAMPVLFMLAAGFRPDRDPEVTQALHDLAWIPFVMAFPPVLIQQLSIAFAIFSNAEQQIFPRWLGYFNAWCALLLVPGALVPFFKSGPFAWHGVFEFWLAGTIFFGWIVVMTVMLFRAVRLQTNEQDPSPVAGTTVA
jgi:hypothetical protein